MQAAADTPEEQQAQNEGRAASRRAAVAPTAAPTDSAWPTWLNEPAGKSPPTWQDTYQQWHDNGYVPWQKARGANPTDIQAWNVDAGSKQTKAEIDQVYINRLNEYNKANGTNIAVDSSVLGANAQPNKATWEPGHGGWIENHLGIKPELLLLAGAAIATGGFGFAGWSSAGAAGTAAGATTGATGLAGTLGMNAGMAATALNAGALNAGVTAVMGGDLKDVLRAGVTGAALSGVGGWAKEAATPFVGSAGASVASGAAMGATGAALTGGDVMQGLTRGAVAGGVSEVGKFAGDAAKSATADYGKTFSSLAGNAANVATRTALTGGDAGTAAGRFATGLASGTVGGWAKEATGSDTVGNMAGMATGSLISGRTPTRAGLLNSLIQSNFKSAGVKDPMEKV